MTQGASPVPAPPADVSAGTHFGGQRGRSGLPLGLPLPNVAGARHRKAQEEDTWGER
jgi:hypothetical protein